MSARDIIADLLWRKESSEYDYSHDDPAWTELADDIIAALVAEGFMVARMTQLPLEARSAATNESIEGFAFYVAGFTPGPPPDTGETRND